MSSYEECEHINFKTIWSIGSTSSGAYTFNGGIYPSITLPSKHTQCNPLFIGTDQYNDINNIRLGIKYLIDNDYGPVLLVNSIGYSIDGGKTDTPGPYIKNVTEDGFHDTRLVSKFSQIVKEYNCENMFWVFNRNYSTQNGKMSGQWANTGYHLLNKMNILNYERFKFIADIGGGSVTFYSFDGKTFTEYKNIKMFLNKKNKESPNQLYEQDSSGKLFAKKFKEEISKYPEITFDNVLLLQTGKMRENSVCKTSNNRVELPDFPYLHYYLKEEFEVECEAMDLCNSITGSNMVKTIHFKYCYANSKDIVNIYVDAPDICTIVYNYVVEWIYSYFI